MSLSKVRVATLQYWVRQVHHWDAFEDQVTSLVECAADYRCQLVVFPEYFTIQLLTLGNVKRPMPEQVRDLAAQRPHYQDMFIRLARKYGVYIVGGSIPSFGEDGRVYNDCFLFNPKGEFASQGKLHMTRFEKEEWLVSGRDSFRVFDTALGRMAVTICYDVEFPEVARGAARAGARILVVPSCTDDRQGFLRVRYCAQARAIENQMYVIHSGTVGTLPAVPAVSLNYGQAAILTPSDFPFARDGIRAEGMANQEQVVVGDLDMDILEDSMNAGPVLPLHDSIRTPPSVYGPELITL
jgi:predicted amidohydrolase